MKTFLLILVMVSSASATTIIAASCSQANVQTAVTAAVSGDTVKTPGPCSNSWASRVDIPSTKGIILDGGGNTTLTKFGFTVTHNATANTFITGFIFTNGVPAANTPTISISSSGCSDAPTRLYGNSFPITTSNNTVIEVDGNGQDLIDHNTFVAGVNSDPNELIHNFGMGFGSNAGWTDTVVPGGSCMLFVEDNSFSFVCSGNPCNYFGSSAMQSYYGARSVFRHNTLSMMQVDFHGTQTNVGARWGEVYENQFNTVTNGNQSDYVVYRAGSGVVFNNNHTGPNSGGGNIHLYEEDAGTWPRAYQVGSGINGQTDGHSTCASGTRNQAALYLWNNTGSMNVNTDGPPVNLNRDFFTSGSQPASMFWEEASGDTCSTTYVYVPYTYPHPLQGTTVPSLNFQGQVTVKGAVILQ